jgi:hypothetical protein
LFVAVYEHRRWLSSKMTVYEDPFLLLALLLKQTRNSQQLHISTYGAPLSFALKALRQSSQ